MSKFPITPLVRQVQGLILQTFDVSEQAAQEYAALLVALAERGGGPAIAARMDWAFRIKKDLGETKKLRWRSEEERTRFEVAQSKRAIMVAIPPYGTMRVVPSPDVWMVDQSRGDALSVFAATWGELWPEVRRRLEQMCERSDKSDHLKASVWTAEGEWLDPGVFMSDQANLFLRIILSEAPVWDFFIKDTEIVHCQPVY